MKLHKMLIIWLIATVTGASLFAESRQILDFETPEERGNAFGQASGMECKAVMTNASSGAWSGAYLPPEWKKGLYEWPSVDIIVPEGRRDWRGYDRMVMDVLSLGEGLDLLKCFVAAPTGAVQRGVGGNVSLPRRAWTRLEVSLKGAERKLDLGNVGRIHLFTTQPLDAKVYFDNIRLLKEGDLVAEPCTPPYRAMKAEMDAHARAKAERDSLARVKMLDRLRADAARVGRSATALLLASAPSTEKVRPRDAREFRRAEELGMRLAQGETEAVQLLVLPVRDVRNLRVEVEALARMDEENGSLPAKCVTVAPVGYVKTDVVPKYATNAGSGRRAEIEAGWYPDPILVFTNAVDVREGDWQSFWISVRCPYRQAAGLYSGTLAVRADGIDPILLPFAVRVNGFALPRTPVMPVAITFDPKPHSATVGKEVVQTLRRNASSPANAWKRQRHRWTDFLADHLIPLHDLYYRQPSSWHYEQWTRLEKQGRLGLIGVGYWRAPKSLESAEIERWRNDTIPRLRKSYGEICRRGWKRRACLYGCDEVSGDAVPRAQFAARELKREFPEVPLFCATGTDPDYGAGDRSPLTALDWFCPKTSDYDVAHAERARRAGKCVWWYVCCGPNAPYANALLETTGIELRLLMGAMAQKYRPDGFLFYQISLWNSPHNLSSGPYTDWAARSYKDYHGDGSWTCTGPGGMPVPTIRLENFRDGLEDLAYAHLLEKATGQRIEVPPTLVKSLTEYTVAPDVLYAWRDRMADELERIHESSKGERK